MLTPLLAAALAARAAEPVKPRFEKVVVVVFENTDYQDAIKQPFFAAFAGRGALLTDYHAVSHPSEPNYVALVSGDTHGIKDDEVYDLDARSVADLIESAGRSWKQYSESYPGKCSMKPRIGRYARKHAPFTSFKPIQTSPARCARLTGGEAFFADLDSRSLPDYSFFVPNLDDDGHDTGVAYADKWFARKFAPLLARWPKGVLLVATFDEDSNSGGTNRVYTALFGDMIKPGARVDERYTHYSLLRTIEREWKLGDLGRNDAKAAPISGVWK